MPKSTELQPRSGRQAGRGGVPQASEMQVQGPPKGGRPPLRLRSAALAGGGLLHHMRDLVLHTRNVHPGRQAGRQRGS